MTCRLPFYSLNCKEGPSSAPRADRGLRSWLRLSRGHERGPRLLEQKGDARPPATPFFRESGEGEAVVCIHASASSSGQWRPLMERLGKRHRLIATDLIGYGRSPAWLGESDLWLDDEVDALAPVLDAAG